MKTVLNFSLVKRAKASGGDRYEAKVNSEDDKPMVIYIPQSISREGSITKQQLGVTIEG